MRSLGEIRNLCVFSFKKGANVEGHQSFMNPLLYTAREGYESIIKLLLSKGANVNGYRYPSGPLALSIKEGH
ncbi:hypothetical protein F5Y11DRAFT_312823 [Daldinia sp. FL1419]|nr:hypothetical protein F5Y11DRAFT_312823 [Daldinia sp. FL1419]